MKYKKEKIKGYVNAVAGKVKEKAGNLIDHTKLKLKGNAQQIKGKAQIASAKTKESVNKVLN